ncbi:MAG: serine/threonine protein kinase [Proteobacteria bacterium]|nr:serine/threonine protein kinase [Pseudomonadota bacterium]
MDSQIQFGRYKLLKLLARGGMGEVYLAQYAGVAGFEKMCVIKKIRADLADQTSFTERFLNEGRTLVALTQSNIVQIFDMGEVDGAYYLAMEYVKGTDLRQILRRMGNMRMPVVCAVAVTREMLKGLGYAHRAVDGEGHSLGIVHRDVSPSNVMVSTEGEVKLIDFGIAKIRTMESSSGVVQGKFAYMSPEQARGDTLDARTDLFSCGIVLYEMLSGVRPFEGDSDLRSLELVKTHKHKPIRDYRPDVSEKLEKILDRVLSKNREDRYQSAEAFYDALEAVMDGQRFDQRDIANYFAPFMSEAQGPRSGFIEDALDEMLNAQAFAQGRMTTRTLDVSSGELARGMAECETCTADPSIQSEDGGGARDGDVSRAEKEELEAPKVAANLGDSAVPASQDDVSRDEHGELESLKVAANLGDSAVPAMQGDVSRDENGDLEAPRVAANLGDSAVPASQDDVSRDEASGAVVVLPKRRRLPAKLRYGMIGGLIVLFVAMVVVAVIWQIDSRERASQFQILLDALRSDENVAQPVAEAAPEERFVPFFERSVRLLEMHRPYRSGVPVLFRTEPESATLYIVEGGYRALDGKSVQLLTDRDVEIALQSPGYETCLFRVRFSGKDSEPSQSIDWENCQGVSAKLSSDSYQIEVDARLSPLRARMADADVRAGQPSALDDGVSAETEQNRGDNMAVEGIASDGEAGMDDTGATALQNVVEQDEPGGADAQPDVAQAKTPEQPARTAAKPAQTKGKTASAKEKDIVEREETRGARTDKKTVSGEFSASMAAELVADGQIFSLPAQVSLPAGTPFEIKPQVSGRKVAVPYRGKFSEGRVRAEFCEATVRIEESYISGDPSPYQAADIYLDGRKVASQVSLVRLVAPCQKYAIEARINTNAAALRGKTSVRLDETASQTISLHLSEE